MDLFRKDQNIVNASTNTGLHRHKPLCYLKKKHGKFFLCSFCQTVFLTSVELDKHVIKHANDIWCHTCRIALIDKHTSKEQQPSSKGAQDKTENALLCPHCQVVLLTEEELERHLKIHTRTGSDRCNMCSSEYKNLADLKKHMLSHLTEGAFPCPVCSLYLEDLNDLEKHLQGHNIKKSSMCFYCGLTFTRSEALEKHKCPESDDKQYCCPLCRKGFNDAMALKQHLFAHRGEKPHMCPHCCAQHRELSDLEDHVKTEHLKVPKKYICIECHREFPKAFSLKRHMYTHTGDWPYVCPQCGKGFGVANELRRHESTHGVKVEKDYRRNHQSKLFVPQETNCTLSVNPNAPPGTYENTGTVCNDDEVGMVAPGDTIANTTCVCPHCNKVFREPYWLEDHLYRHKGLCPHVCSMCKKGFLLQSDLAVHMVRHNKKENIVWCPKCPKKYQSHSQLNHHMGSHSEIEYNQEFGLCAKLDVNPYACHDPMSSSHGRDMIYSKCYVCIHGFSTENELENHLKSHKDLKSTTL